tara:strand:+ start:930 stop:1265 length:336 start_codon:yes stop_codon:yes gene_type:complete
MNETRQEPPREGQDVERRSFLQRLISVTPGDLIRLVFLSIIAGLVLAAFRVDPRRLWVDFFGTIYEAWGEFIDLSADLVRWSVDYLILGAILVVPIWIVWRILSAFNRRNR